MEVSVATFNLNNLFGRWNLYVDAPAPPPTGAPARANAEAATTATAAAPERDWLEKAPPVEGARSRRKLPDVKIVTVTAGPPGEIVPVTAALVVRDRSSGPWRTIALCSDASRAYVAGTRIATSPGPTSARTRSVPTPDIARLVTSEKTAMAAATETTGR
jgi:hypothetical protein